VQFGALDHSQRKSTIKLPVVCVIGINYSQQKMQADTNNLFPYQGGYHDLVAFYTGCYGPTAHVIVAYNRNKTSWENPPPIVVPRSPIGRYGSVNATDMDFVLQKNIAHWLLTLNINSQAHLSFDGTFRRKNNPRFPLFGPEKTR
jgi:hypothetical protein